MFRSFRIKFFFIKLVFLFSQSDAKPIINAKLERTAGGDKSEEGGYEIIHFNKKTNSSCCSCWSSRNSNGNLNSLKFESIGSLKSKGCKCCNYSNEEGVYKGEVRIAKNCDGKEVKVRHGIGVMVYHSGGVYEGEWREGRRNGSGIEKNPAQIRSFQTLYYKGGWKDDLYSGQGTHIYSCIENGKMVESSYVGEFVNGLRQGSGTWKKDINDPKSTQYEGQFDKDFRHGYGEMKWADNSCYNINNV